MKLKQILLVSTVACVGACALATATPPQIEVASVQLRGLGLLDQRLDVGLCVTNPNDRDLAFKSVTVGIDVAGAPLADGVSEGAVRLPARQSVLVPFAVTTTVRGLGTQLATGLSSALSTGTIPYHMHGTVQLTGLLGIPVPFSRSGQFELLTASQTLLADPPIATPTACAVTTRGTM